MLLVTACAPAYPSARLGRGGCSVARPPRVGREGIRCHFTMMVLRWIPNANLLHDLGGGDRLGGRLWRLPPFSANTWHKHVDSWEFYFLLEGLGRMRIGENTVTVPKYGCVLVAPQVLRQIFNDT